MRWAVFDLLDDLGGIRLVDRVVGGTWDGSDNHIQGEADEDDTDALVEDAEETECYDAAQKRGELAFQHVEAQRGDKHATKEQEPVGDIIVVAADDHSDDGGPVEPDSGVHEVKHQTPEIDAEARWDLDILEGYAVGRVNLGRMASFDEHGIDAKACDDGRSYIDNPTVAEHKHHLVDGDARSQQKENGYYKNIAGADTVGERDSITEAVMDACLQLREERRSEAETERQGDTA